jgi:acetyl esterase/lipase
MPASYGEHDKTTYKFRSRANNWKLSEPGAGRHPLKRGWLKCGKKITMNTTCNSPNSCRNFLSDLLLKSMRILSVLFLGCLALAAPFAAGAEETSGRPFPAYRSKLNVVYARVGDKELTLNAFLPVNTAAPVPAMVEIHGGWWFGGDAASQVEGVGGWQLFMRHNLAVFSIRYRLGDAGGFPQNIRDCRNAIRFIRQNAKRFNIDPNRIEVTGGSAGGHLSLMVAMVPENFADGGPTAGLENVSARVSGSFSYIPPTDFVRFWNQGPDDVITNQNGKISIRGPDDKIPDDSHPRLRVLFHGITPDTDEHKLLYTRMCPIGQVRQDVPPLLICDGEKDPIVPGLHGKALYEKLKASGADATYWMTPGGGHAFPGGARFDKELDDFLVRTLQLDPLPTANRTIR